MVLGVFLPDVKMFSFVFDESIVVFCRLGAWPEDCEFDEPVEPTKILSRDLLNIYSKAHVAFFFLKENGLQDISIKHYTKCRENDNKEFIPMTCNYLY